MSDREDVVRLVQRLNAAWSEGRLDELGDFFHADAVLVTPDFAKRVEGREKVVESYRDFVGQAVLHGFEMEPPDVEVVGAVAVATCPYRMEYEIGGGRWRASGRDLLVLQRAQGSWRVVWRTLLPESEEEVGTGEPRR